MGLSEKIVTLSNRVTARFRRSLYRDLPVVDLGPAHVAHLRSLPDRTTLLHMLPPGGVAAEIGVNRGDFSAQILEITKPARLILIDVWASKRYHDGLFDLVRGRFADRMASGQVEIIRALSFDGITRCADASFDWGYLDTDHTYATTKRELELLAPKMKPDGIIAGHDYIIGNWNDGYRYGVIEAVHEFCRDHHWELVYLTHEMSVPPSFAIRRMRDR
jgi:hypothetical protein